MYDDNVDYNECQICGLKATTSNKRYSYLCSLCASCEEGPPMTLYDVMEEEKINKEGEFYDR